MPESRIFILQLTSAFWEEKSLSLGSGELHLKGALLFVQMELTMASYQELLSDPKWQRRRLEIFLRDDFTCQRCGNDRLTLCVHHFSYTPGLLPWEYPDEDLITWCIDCHEKEHDKLNFLDIAEHIVSKPFTLQRSLLLDRLIIEYGI
jgi:hypothetical protein